MSKRTDIKKAKNELAELIADIFIAQAIRGKYIFLNLKEVNQTNVSKQKADPLQRPA